MKAIYLFTIIVLVFCDACISNNRRFPQEKRLSEYTKTEFLPTLENKISGDKNAVYCVSFLYAWDEIRKELGAPLKVDSQLNDLNLLNNSKSYLNVLSEDEYSVKAKVVENDIIAEAFFSKSLPFSEKLSSFRDSLIFDKTKVTSFGLLGNDYAVLYVVEILYHNDDNNFVIKILLKDANHEIILAKFDRRFETMIEMFSEIQNKIVLGKEEQENQALSWKYRIMSNDEVVIPKLQFNISTNYQTLEGQVFYTDFKQWQIKIARQRTAFILDESGAEVESLAKLHPVCAHPKGEQPKRMRFDKPFLLVLKKKNSENPYFGLWVANDELMEKE